MELVDVTTDYLGPEAMLRLPDVDEALDYGHSIHAADDCYLEGTVSQQIARQIAEEFLALQAKRDTVEVPYLRIMKNIARSYGRALTREKDRWLRETQDAIVQRRRRESKLRSARLSTLSMGALSKYVIPIMIALVLGLTGFLFAQVLGHAVPDVVSDKTGKSLPSVVLGLTFVLAGRLFAKWWYDRRTDQIIKAYEARRYKADQDYEDAKLREFKHWRQRACEAWKQYTGTDYPDRASYQMVMEADMRTRQDMRNLQATHDKSDVERLQEIVKLLVGKVRRNGNGERPAESTHPAE